MFQNAAQRGSSRRAPSRNSGVWSEASCSCSFFSQISAKPLQSGSGLSYFQSTRVQTLYFLICGILLAYFTAWTLSQ